MPVFYYTARDQSGQVTNGQVEAASESEAAANLRKQGLWVTQLRVGSPGGPAAAPAGPRRDTSFSKRLRSPVSPRDLSIFYRQLYTLLHSGVPFYQAVEMLSQPNQCPNPHLRPVVAVIAQHVLTGGRFSEPMYRFPWLFDRLQIRMVEAGELGGMLPDIFRRLSEYLERESELRMEIARKSLYPMLTVLMLILVWPINIPLTLQGYLRDLSVLVLWIGGGGAFLWFFGRVFLTSEAGKNLMDQVKLALPVIGGVIRKIVTARFARSLAALYGAGVPIASALDMAGETAGSHVVLYQIRKMVPAVERGVPLTQCFSTATVFPAMFVGMVSTGESTGNLDTMLDKAAEYYEEESRHSINQMVVILGVVLLVCVAIIVLIKVVSFYTGYLGGIMNSAGGGAGGE